MLYVFSGNDVVVVREKAHTQIAKLEAGGLGARRIEAEHYATGVLPSLAESVSLFGVPEIIILDTLSDVAGALEDIVAHAEILSRSVNTFVILENKILGTSAKELKTHAKEYIVCDSAKQTFNIFSLSEALAQKDKKSLWLSLLRARENGCKVEDIIGTLSWQLKSLRLARLCTTAEEAGMKDFPFRKAQRANTKFSTKELQDLSLSLVTLYHEGHAGIVDIDLALEKWVLSI